MRRRGVGVLLLAAGLLLTVSLYLPWMRGLNCFGPCPTLDGWRAGAAAGAAMCALLNAVLAVLDLRDVQALGWVPRGRCAVCAAYFILAVGSGVVQSPERVGLWWWAYGPIVALVALLLLVVAAWRVWDGSLPERERLAVRLTGVLLVLALLTSFLLPWLRLSFENSPGIDRTAVAVAAVLAVWLAAAWWRTDAGVELLGLSAAVLLFTAGGLTILPWQVRAPGAWAGLGLAATLVVLAALRSPRPTLPALPGWREAIAVAAAVLFAGSLFLPWSRFCGSGRCGVSHGWSWQTNTAAAGLGLALALSFVFPELRVPARPMLAAGMALFVATSALATPTGRGYSFAYGSWLGFACTAALVAVGLAGARLRRPARERVAGTAFALTASAAYVTLLLLPSWYVFSPDIAHEIRFGGFTWLTMVGALLGVQLIALWLSGSESAELVALPLAMLTLAALDLVEFRLGLTWGGVAVVALCLVLALAGRIRLYGVPEILRIDRIQVPDP